MGIYVLQFSKKKRYKCSPFNVKMPRLGRSVCGWGWTLNGQPGEKLAVVLVISSISENFTEFKHITHRQSWSWAEGRLKLTEQCGRTTRQQQPARPSLPQHRKLSQKADTYLHPQSVHHREGGRERRKHGGQRAHKASENTLLVFFLFPVTEIKSSSCVSLYPDSSSQRGVEAATEAASTTTAGAATVSSQPAAVSAQREGGAEVAAAHARTNFYCETKIV